uniref:Uncharacterized protein n=1 Tax=Arundo donax TaxID=35708 RepID=A0A0A8ZQW6_ARUDO
MPIRSLLSTTKAISILLHSLKYTLIRKEHENNILSFSSYC